MEPAQIRVAVDLCGFLFLGSGVLALVDALLFPRQVDRASLLGVGLVDLGLGFVLPRLPWERWPQRMPLLLIPPVLGIIVASDTFTGNSPYFYPVFFVLTFLWIGMAQPPGTSLMLSPLAAAAYAVPFTLPGHAPGLHTLPAVVGVCVLVGEAEAWLLYQIRTSRAAEREAMALARDEAMEAARLKSEFLAMMSHELRTPLNGVIGALGLVDDEALPAGPQEMVRVARSSSRALLGIIDDILDFSRLEAGGVRLAEAPFDLYEVVGEVVSLLDVLASQKRVFMRVEADPEGWRLVGDAGRIRQVLINLAGNAVKFTEKGQVTLRLAREEAGVRVEVEDTGVGIPPDQLDAVFDPFRQADASTSRRHGGSGLGLAISKRLVTAMGGRINVRSAVGSGSIFWFTLPLAVDTSPVVEAPPSEAFAPAARPVRALVVDDNIINLRIAQAQLKRLGHAVDLAANGLEALERLASGSYDIVFMDCQMPDLDGFEATAELRRRGCRLPVVAMTAGVLQQDRDRCTAAGMDDFVPKPVQTDGLQQVIEKWVT